MNMRFSECFGAVFAGNSCVLPADTTVEQLAFSAQERQVNVVIKTKEYISFRKIEQAEQQVAKALALRAIQFIPTPNADRYQKETVLDILEYIKTKKPMTVGVLQEAELSVESGGVTITLAHGGAGVLKTAHLEELFQGQCRRWFGKEITLTVGGGDSLDREEMQKREQAIQKKAEEKQEKPKEVKFSGPSPDGLPYYSESAKLIYGNRMPKNPKPIRDVSPDDGTACIWGEIFSVESRDTRDGRTCRFTFMLTDQTGSYTAKIAAEKASGQYAVFEDK
ncbi:MAG: hypothetical protein IKU10_07055, partial [Clostridia bacterium]|nr:hypothetical protein [Clostridia bacterium]